MTDLKFTSAVVPDWRLVFYFTILRIWILTLKLPNLFKERPARSLLGPYNTPLCPLYSRHLLQEVTLSAACAPLLTITIFSSFASCELCCALLYYCVYISANFISFCLPLFAVFRFVIVLGRFCSFVYSPFAWRLRFAVCRWLGSKCGAWLHSRRFDKVNDTAGAAWSGRAIRWWRGDRDRMQSLLSFCF